jgi:hypothetical protein
MSGAHEAVTLAQPRQAYPSRVHAQLLKGDHMRVLFVFSLVVFFCIRQSI